MKKPSVPAELTRIIKFMLSVGASEETILRSFQNAARGSNEAAGLGYEDVVKTTCYLADMEQFRAFNEVYATFFPAPFPARTTIQAARLPMDILVEVEAIAVRR